MKKQGVARIFARNFLKTFAVIALFLFVGVLSYQLTMLYYRQTSRVERSSAYTHVITVNPGKESSNLIYSYDKDTGKIKAMVLELFDENTKNLAYITIPANTQITISSKTYAELLEKSQKLPQLVTMSDINDYFSGDVAYEYGIIILKEELEEDIGYFTAFSSDKFDTYFKNTGSEDNPRYQPSDELLKQAGENRTKKAMDKMMDKLWDELYTDITLSQKQNYSEALTQVNPNFIRTYSAHGSATGDVYILNQKKSNNLINKFWESKAYTREQGKKDMEGSTPAAAHTIQITNGSGIDGLASAYRDKLRADGWNVSDVGNYVGSIQTKTVIYANKKSWARGLLTYFKDATIKKANNLTNGVEIEIVLGTQDDLTEK